MWKKSEIVKWMCETHATNQKIGCRIFTMTQLTKVLLSLKIASERPDLYGHRMARCLTGPHLQLSPSFLIHLTSPWDTSSILLVGFLMELYCNTLLSAGDECRDKKMLRQ